MRMSEIIDDSPSPLLSITVFAKTVIPEIREELREEYNVEYGEYKNYTGLCNEAIDILIKKVSFYNETCRYMNKPELQISCCDLHGEQKHHPRIKSTNWYLEHTWAYLYNDYLTIYVDPTCSQFQDLYNNIPDYYIDTKPPKWFCSDRRHPVYCNKLFFNINEKIKIKRIGIIDYLLYKIWGGISDKIHNKFYINKYKKKVYNMKNYEIYGVNIDENISNIKHAVTYLDDCDNNQFKPIEIVKDENNKVININFNGWENAWFIKNMKFTKIEDPSFDNDCSLISIPPIWIGFKDNKMYISNQQIDETYSLLINSLFKHDGPVEDNIFRYDYDLFNANHIIRILNIFLFKSFQHDIDKNKILIDSILNKENKDNRSLIKAKRNLSIQELINSGNFRISYVYNRFGVNVLLLLPYIDGEEEEISRNESLIDMFDTSFECNHVIDSFINEFPNTRYIIYDDHIISAISTLSKRLNDDSTDNIDEFSNFIKACYNIMNTPGAEYDIVYGNKTWRDFIK